MNENLREAVGGDLARSRPPSRLAAAVKGEEGIQTGAVFRLRPIDPPADPLPNPRIHVFWNSPRDTRLSTKAYTRRATTTYGKTGYPAGPSFGAGPRDRLTDIVHGLLDIGPFDTDWDAVVEVLEGVRIRFVHGGKLVTGALEFDGPEHQKLYTDDFAVSVHSLWPLLVKGVSLLLAFGVFFWFFESFYPSLLKGMMSVPLPTSVIPEYVSFIVLLGFVMTVGSAAYFRGARKLREVSVGRREWTNCPIVYGEEVDDQDR